MRFLRAPADGAPAARPHRLPPLAKDQAERWQSASDVAREFRWINESAVSARVAAAPVADRARRDRLIFGGVDRPGQVQPVSLLAKAYVGPRISSDGGRVVVWTQRDRKVWVHDLARVTLTLLTSTVGWGRRSRPAPRACCLRAAMCRV